ncbi:MAG: phosphate ABC transporter permease PstA [Eubacteriales bacterium]|nr:phosphate ABC transporter permease PstA [Eubacteriales bacterium]
MENEAYAKNAINKLTLTQKIKAYRNSPMSLFLLVMVVLSAAITVFILFSIAAYILVKGLPHLTPEIFAWEYNSENVSMMPAIINTLTMTGLSLIFAVPIGVFSAIYLVEYAKRGNRLVGVVRITAETLSGIPSIVYGLFGYLLFVIACGFGYTIIGGALTLAIMILPLIMRTTEEALKSVPDTFREGSYGLGAGRLRTIFRIVLPSAVPGILSGVILGIGRIVGETAALLYTAGTVAGIPETVMDSGRTLSIHMWSLLSEGLYVDQAYATAVVLLGMVVLINMISGYAAKKIALNH